MTLHISSVFTYDEDAGNYIQAVEAADGQVLEGATRKAINNFVIGCKADGIWDAIKASCILAGARTLSGALVPLVGTAPTNYNFVAGDYNRKTGLIGDGSTKYLDSNRNNNADPQNSNHNAVYVSSTSTSGNYMGATAATNEIGDNNFGRLGSFIYTRSRTTTSSNLVGKASAIGLIAINRSQSGSYIARALGADQTNTIASQVPFNANISVFASGTGIGAIARIAFYSIGESLNLALLDARVTDLITAFGAAIP